jgi:YD repeat-containing protein
VKTVYNYNGDPLNRLQSVSWDTSGFGDTANAILGAATVSYSYRTQSSSTDLKDITQLSSVTTSGVSTESYSYDTEGRISSKTLTLTSRPYYPFVTDYTYDSLNRVKDVWYPQEYGNGTQPRKLVHHDYDIASRLSSLTYDGQSFASNLFYNAASQASSLNIGNGTDQIIETYGYDAQTGLLSNQTVARTATPTTHLLDLNHDYANASGKRTGQLTKILNNLNHNKDRGYSYDAMGRLVQATGGPSASPLWTQNYSYDRYGNRTSVSASGYSAKGAQASSPAEQRASLPASQRDAVTEPRAVASGSNTQAATPSLDFLARNNIDPLTRGTRPTVKDKSEPVSDSPPTLHAPSSLPDGPPTFTDDPVVAGVTIIKALHVTELRNAINQLRVRAGLSTVSWAESVSSGVTIKASHIMEMRTRLEEARTALGLSSTTCTDPGLTGYIVKAAHIQELRDSFSFKRF